MQESLEWIFRTFSLCFISTKSNHPGRFSSEVSPLLRFFLQRMMLNAWSLATLVDVKRGGCCGVKQRELHVFGPQAG